MTHQYSAALLIQLTNVVDRAKAAKQMTRDEIRGVVTSILRGLPQTKEHLYAHAVSGVSVTDQDVRKPRHELEENLYGVIIKYTKRGRVSYLELQRKLKVLEGKI